MVTYVRNCIWESEMKWMADGQLSRFFSFIFFLLFLVTALGYEYIVILVLNSKVLVNEKTNYKIGYSAYCK